MLNIWKYNDNRVFNTSPLDFDQPARLKNQQGLDNLNDTNNKLDLIENCGTMQHT